jgi:glycosyltransferase involved in cell wall biosynthesis
MIEAMACGTPVIAYRSGSVPEVVEGGVTGYVVESEAESYCTAVAYEPNRGKASGVPTCGAA